jgi:hypothetical protein
MLTMKQESLISIRSDGNIPVACNNSNGTGVVDTDKMLQSNNLLFLRLVPHKVDPKISSLPAAAWHQGTKHGHRRGTHAATLKIPALKKRM